MRPPLAQTKVTDQRPLGQADALDTLALDLYRPQFPAAWAVPLAAGTLWDAAGQGGHVGDVREGPAWYCTVAPGMVAFGSVDKARGQRQLERQLERRGKRVDQAVGWMQGEGLRAQALALAAGGLIDQADVPDALTDPLSPGVSRSRIREWSQKSRINMLKRLSTLDYSGLLDRGGVPAMVTLTLPEDWQSYAPTGRDFKRLIRNFGKRYRRAFGRPLVGLWKLEFQRRGAPHCHFLTVPPAEAETGIRWRQWFAATWADVLGVQGETRRAVIAVHEHRKASADYAEGLRASDPKRVAVYFLGHNLLKDKEYQHIVPEAWRGPGDGPGRFWGYLGLARADSVVPVTYDQAVTLARTLRRWQRAQGGTRRARVWRVNTSNGVVRRRSVLRRVKRQRATAGFSVVNDGPAVALMLAGVLRT
jgi:hypothetical protein